MSLKYCYLLAAKIWQTGKFTPNPTGKRESKKDREREREREIFKKRTREIEKYGEREKPNEKDKAWRCSQAREQIEKNNDEEKGAWSIDACTHTTANS
jgi:hypothetical protein